jgi:hypothetical protein
MNRLKVWSQDTVGCDKQFSICLRLWRALQQAACWEGTWLPYAAQLVPGGGVLIADVAGYYMTNVVQGLRASRKRLN